MSDVAVEDRIAMLERKLDLILEELSHMKRVRNSAEDLLADLALVGKDAVGDAAEALGSTTIRPVELAHLLKSVLRDAGLLTSVLQQLESAADFVQDAQPIARDLFGRAVAGCQNLQQKGYLDAAATGMRVADALVASHTSDDWLQVEASVPHLVGLLRQLTRPEALQALETIVHGFGHVQATLNSDKSYFQLMREINSPDARRGIAIMVEFLKAAGSSNTNSGRSVS